MAHKPVARGFYIGLAIGQLWLTLVSTFFASILWVLGQNTLQISLILFGVGVIFLCLFVASLLLLRRARRLPPSSAPAQDATRGRKVRRLFGLVVLAEVVVIGTLNTVLVQTNHSVWVTPITFFVVGLHFLPLAFVFSVRPYFVLGLLWVLVVLLTVIIVPSTSIAAQGLPSWVMFPLIGCGVATWCIVAYILKENISRVRQLVAQTVAP